MKYSGSDGGTRCRIVVYAVRVAAAETRQPLEANLVREGEGGSDSKKFANG